MEFCNLVQKTIFTSGNPFADVAGPVTIFVPDSTVDDIADNDLLSNLQRNAIKNVLNKDNPSAADRETVVDFLRLHTVGNAFTVDGLCGPIRPITNSFPTLANLILNVTCTTTRVSVSTNPNISPSPTVDPGDGIANNAIFHYINGFLSSPN